MNIDATPIEWPRHGGELHAAAERYGIPATDWLDLSTGVNPRPWPVPPLARSLYTQLPERAALAGLIDAARTACAIPASVAIAAAPGTDLAIRLLPLLLPAGPVAIFGPTYESHGQAWEDAGRTVMMCDPAVAIPGDARVAIIVNPNNPDGRVFATDLLAEIASTLARRDGILVVDEAFGDVAPGSSISPVLDRVPALVLRSFGKFYGLPGLRLGFIAGPPRLVGRLTRLFGDWPVSTVAIEIGIAALSDTEWQAATRKSLAEDSRRLHDMLVRHGFDIVGGTDLFVLASHAGALAIHRALAQQAILTRVFRYAPDWIRFGLPPSGAFDRLDSALHALRR
jgi:cobalamin biosynthetic protein CobC